MNTVRICQSCRKPLPADAPEGLCPECLVKVGLGSGVNTPATPSGAPTMPTPGYAAVEVPSLDEVAKLFPQLEILEVLGQGGMGVVYKARQKQLDRLVALKIMLPQFSRDPAFVERFNREARALAKLNHPNIVAVYDFGQTGDTTAPLCFFIMEFVDGANLRHLIQSGQLKPAEALAIVPKICEALQFAHDEGVVHRDIKPANILIDKKGRVKIADFGLAKLAGATDVSLTRSQQGMGTPQYMAPEQLENAKSVDHRADIYSLGVVFYEMLTGELPLGRFDPPSARVQVDVRLDEIVLKALEKRPERRYQQASEVKTQVESVAGSGAMPTPGGSGSVPLPEAAHGAAASRFSRGAILGAVWALFGLLAVVPALFFTAVDRVSSGAAKPTDLVHQQPPLAFTIFMGVLLVIGAGAPIGTTILGAVSIGNIKRSGGKLIGLPLAFADAVLFPLLAFGGIAGGLMHLVQIAFWTQTHTSYSSDGSGQLLNPIAPDPAHRPDASFLILDVVAALVVCCFAGWIAWRKIAGKKSPEAERDRELERQSRGPGLSLLALGGAILGLLGLLAATGFVLLHFNYFYESGGRSLRPGDWMRIATALCVLTGIAAVGATILGGLAIAQIKRSGGKFYGLPLAFADSVFFPLLFVGALVAVPFGLAVALIFKLPSGPGEILIFGSLPAMAVCFLIGRAGWRKVVGAVPPAAIKPFAGSTSHVVLNVVLSVFTLWFMLEFGFPVAEMITGPDTRLIEVGRQWNLGTTVDSIFSKLAAFAALLAVGNFLAWRSFRKATAKAESAVGPAQPLDHRVSEAVAVDLPGWFHGRARWVQLLIEAALLLVFMFGLVSLLGFQTTQTSDITAGTKVARTITSVRIGTPTPWLTAEFGGLKHGISVHWFASSLWIGLVGAAAAWVYEMLRRSRPGFDAEADRRKQRKWWIIAAAVCGVTLALFITVISLGARRMESSARGVMERALGLAEQTTFEIAKDPSKLPATTTPGRRDFAFTFNAPSNHVLNVWLEFWKDGKLEIPTAFSESYLPARGDSIRGGLHLTTQDGDMAGAGSAGQMRFDWALIRHARVVSDISKLDSKSTSASGQWRTNLFKARAGLASQLSWDDQSVPTVWRPKPGEVTTVLEWTGHAGKSVSSSDLKWTEEGLPKGTPMVAILLRVRFDPIAPDQLSVAPMTKTAAINTKNRGSLPKPPPSRPQTVAPQATTNAPPAAAAPDSRFNIQQDRSQLPATATPGRQDYAFRFAGPADHSLNVWMEVWQEGKMEWVSGFDFEAKPKADKPLEASLKVTAMGGDAAGKENKGKTRLDWTMNCGGSEGKSQTANALIADLSVGMGATYSTWDRQPKPLNPRPGETVTVLGITGYKLSNFRSIVPVLTEVDLLKRWPNAAVLIRARFSPIRPEEADGQFKPARKLDEGASVSVNVSDKTFEKRTFAQFEISKQLGVDLSACRTQTDAHAALVAAASTPDGHARAAQMIDEFGSDNIGYNQVIRGAVEPMQKLWWQLRKKEPVTAEELVGTLEKFITDLDGAARYSIWWLRGEPITKLAEGPFLNADFAKKLKLTKLQIDEVNKLFKKYADEANALSRRHTKVTKNAQGHVLINIEPHSEECLELARKMVAELGGIVTQDIVPAVKVGALPSAIFGDAGECREVTVLKKDADGVYVITISRSDWVTAHGSGNGNGTTSWGSKDIDLAFGSYKMYWTEE